jgi:hypothetical protein
MILTRLESTLDQVSRGAAEAIRGRAPSLRPRIVRADRLEEDLSGVP